MYESKFTLLSYLSEKTVDLKVEIVAIHVNPNYEVSFPIKTN